VARLLDAGVNEFGQPYLVMEWIDGVALDVWMRERAPSGDERLDLWLQIAAAVSYAHRHLIIHRDLKPSNVLVTADGVPKLVDFGIAKRLEESRAGRDTLTAQYTPLYASPEQIGGQSVSTATDIYGLGLLLFELMTGQRPFADAAAHDRMRAVLERDVRIPDAVPADLAAVIGMALRKEPERRYATVEQFAEDVRRYRAGHTVAAQPDTWAYKARRFVGRHRVTVALGAAATISLVTLTGIAVWQARIANAQRARAEQVTNFITGFLGATPSSPDWALQNKGVSLRVSELADLVGSRVDQELGRQPEAEGTLREVLAMIYYQMGDIAKVHQNAGRAIDLYDHLYPADDPRRLSAELIEAAAEIAMGQFANGEARARRVAALWTNPPPTAAPVIATQLGVAQLRLGRLAESEQTFKEGIARVETALGPDHPSLALLCSNFSLVFLERGQFERAAAQLERAVAISRATYKDASMPLAWALVNLSNIYRFLGRTDDEQAAAEESLKQFEGALGPTHYSTIHALSFIAHTKAIKGEAGAEVAIRRGIANQAQLPADHYERAVGLTFLGFVLMQQKQLPEAKHALEDALRIRRQAFKSPNWRIAETAGWLGEVLVGMGQRVEGRKLLEESLADFTTLYGPDNPRTIDPRTRLGRY
jgi:serine/threonine-protein kinase